MKPKQIFNSILAVLFVFPLMGAFAQQAANSDFIEVITTFDYPGTGNLTEPQKINDQGDIVGIYLDSNLVSRGFVRFSDGSFSDPIVEPNDTVGFTQARGINNSGTVCGDYASSDSNEHGFFMSGGTFTEYDIPGALSTKRAWDKRCRRLCRHVFFDRHQRDLPGVRQRWWNHNVV